MVKQGSFAAVFVVLCVFCMLGGVQLGDMYLTHRATSRVQHYIDARVKMAEVHLEAKVSDCVELPVKNKMEHHDWACVVTLTTGSETEVQVLQFTQNNLNGKDDPKEEPAIQFDHSKDTNI